MNLVAGFMRYIGRGMTLADMKMKDLRQQLREYDLEERKLGQELKAFESDQQKLLAEYKHARDSNNQTQVDFIARQFEGKKDARKSLDSRHATLIKHRRLVQNLKMLKDNEEWVKKLSGGKWLNMSVEDLQEAMHVALEKQYDNNATVDELLESMESHREAESVEHADTSAARAEMDRLLDGDSFKDKINEEISSIDQALEESRETRQPDRVRLKDEPQ